MYVCMYIRMYVYTYIIIIIIIIIIINDINKIESRKEKVDAVESPPQVFLERVKIYFKFGGKPPPPPPPPPFTL